MPFRFFYKNVIINGVKANLDDKFKFDEDFCNNKIKIRTILENDNFMDIETY